MFSTRRIVCAAVFGVFVLAPAGAQPPNDDAARMVARWDQLRRAAPVVSYVIRWDSFPTNPNPDAPKPGEDGAYTGSALVLLDPTRKRLRMDKDEITHILNRRERLSRVRTIHRYDGNEQSFAQAHDFDAAKAPIEPVFPSIWLGPWGSSARLTDEFGPLFWVHGLIWTERVTALPFDWRAKPGQFRSSGREAVEGRACIILHDTTARTESKETLWVDDERGVIVRWRIERANGYGAEIRIRYQETPHGWLPQTWERSDLRPDRPPAVARRVRVEALTFDPVVSDDDFRIALRPEMTVHRNSFALRVRDDGTLEPEPTPPAWSDTLVAHVSTWAKRIGWLGLGGVVTAAVLLGVLVRLRMQRSAAGSRSTPNQA
ncbi:hypothetical protein [Frigoriglobus tundricola]|uniref:Uncharacterized protein n=1 Tax=Frigoriglobus tundricola TaxID=2774151 RepID=A0A6M5YPS8_9BACT|nr:hypothetical protein [Frigoriglobus tundricola]QJW95504.1 hypothetical protein FTUN_3053 [Frigoriglobus tundricola]